MAHKLQCLVVLELSPTTPESTRNWILSRLKSPKIEGGADLLVEDVESVVHVGSYLLHIGANLDHLLRGAEEIGLRKRRKEDGETRDFDYDHRDDFEPLTQADALKVVKHDLDNLRATGEETIPGLSKTRPLYPGKSIVRRLKTAGVLTQAFPLHDPVELKGLKSKMFFGLPFLSDTLPLGEIRDYFGETISFYFAFLRFFAFALLPVVTVAVPYYAFGGRKDFEAFLFFAIYNLVWASLLVEIWKRKSARHAFNWGTLRLFRGHVEEEPRAGFHGTLGANPVTGRMEPKYPPVSRYLKMSLVSLPIVVVCMLVAAGFMEAYFYFEDMALEAYDTDPSTFNNIVSFVPSVIYSVVIFLSNMSYRPLAHRLTEFENHRTESQHLNHLVLKILIFDSFNCFGALFYVAFWMRDMKRLRADLASLLIMNQILEQLVEVVMPYIYTWRARRRFRGLKGGKKLEKLRSNVGLDESKLVQAETEADMPPYEGTFDDYLELFLHFGYISLFSCVYPLASVWAFVNNLLETRTDSFKFLSVHQRPFPQSSGDVGVWQLAFEMMGVVAISTNVALIAMSPDFAATVEGVFDQWQIFVILVVTEHLLVFLKFVVAHVIPDWPEDIRNMIMKENYQSHAALKQRGKPKSE